MSPVERFQWKVVVPVTVLVLAGVLVWWVLVGPPGYRQAQFYQPQPTTEVIAVQTPKPNEWSNLAAGTIESSVAVQTFSGNRIARFGTGTVVSSDGLIVTVADAVPVTSPSAVYQVVAPGRVLRALVVKRDLARNLALLKADAGDLSIARMTQTRPLVGTPLAIVGGIVDVSEYAPFFAHGWLSYDANRFGVLDADFQSILAGGRVLDTDGRQVGVIFLRSGQVRVVWTDQIDGFVQEYLDAIATQ